MKRLCLLTGLMNFFTINAQADLICTSVLFQGEKFINSHKQYIANGQVISGQGHILTNEIKDEQSVQSLNLIQKINGWNGQEYAELGIRRFKRDSSNNLTEGELCQVKINSFSRDNLTQCHFENYTASFNCYIPTTNEVLTYRETIETQRAQQRCGVNLIQNISLRSSGRGSKLEGLVEKELFEKRNYITGNEKYRLYDVDVSINVKNFGCNVEANIYSPLEPKMNGNHNERNIFSCKFAIQKLFKKFSNCN